MTRLSKMLLAELESFASQQRYDYLIKEVHKQAQVWILADKNGPVLLNNEGTDCVPIWPHEECIESWIEGDWADCRPKAIELSVWLERWTTGLTEDGIDVAIFPNLEEEGLVITAAEFEEDLSAK